MNLKKMAIGLAAALIALLLIYFSIPQIKQQSHKIEPPAVLPMPGVPPPAPPQKK
jgi:hypothetical protein